MTFNTLAKDLSNNEKIDNLGKNIYKTLDELRLKTADSIKKISDYNDFNLYEMSVYYDYDLDSAIKVWDKFPDSSQIMEYLIGIALPGVSVHYETPNYGCSAFKVSEASSSANDASLLTNKVNSQFYMGRSYDFIYDTSSMLVRCNPKNGYKSVSFVGLDHIKILDPILNEFCRAACLATPFIPLDGINEKGVSVAVLSLDSDPVMHKNKKPLLTPGTFNRLILDKASSANDAVKLLKNYDMFSVCGRDYHYFITDASGNSVVVEYDCNNKSRPLTVTPSSSITNFYKKYEDKVIPNQKNGKYGHGMERNIAIQDVISKHGGAGGMDVVWEALRACAQDPNPDDPTSNTQWSVVYNNSNLTGQICLRRKWDDIFNFKL